MCFSIVTDKLLSSPFENPSLNFEVELKHKKRKKKKFPTHASKYLLWNISLSANAKQPPKLL